MCASDYPTTLQLQFGHVFETHSSLKTNTAVIKTGTQEKGFVLYDIPGQYRLRSLAVDQLAATAKAVVFVVDSHTCRAAIADVSAWLYTVVAHNIISSGRVPIVLACNKQDMFGAPSPTAIAASLLAEMNKIRTTRMSDTTLGGNEVFLGHSNKPLAWADLPNTIVVMGCSIHDSDGLLEYISSLE
ncbi:hypothetical protein SARC_05081 [Sphaeroforma arctica JP610]|uniref:Signal recognition particle receptor subunit beta n=1 Tax=Sphaeroforma arctica JP610 TaxID=667725 RepID=A0A0L0G1G3_9EUKA|nr:hypothetical protein SARC_05081 [Sphaeroforma arctica JP610]KNC82641.1 hypothetical protein SARC_05081 [Sphaeroforma arctica JP610]|eukprot:XP_014156543.1 hypothetical protein SARC_05081 [Sphaeroforma arctica JP610]